MSESFWTGFWVFIGTLSGVLTTWGAGYLSSLSTFRKRREQVIFEIDFSRNKVREWQNELEKFMNAIAGGQLNNYFGWFDISKAGYPTIHNMYYSGEAYSLFDKESLLRIQRVFNEFNPASEQYINDGIARVKASNDKDEAIKYYNWLYGKFRGYITDLETVESHIKSKKGLSFIRKIATFSWSKP